MIDRIKVYVNGDAKIIEYVNKFSDYIANEILADKIQFGANGSGFKQDWKIERIFLDKWSSGMEDPQGWGIQVTCGGASAGYWKL